MGDAEKIVAAPALGAGAGRLQGNPELRRLSGSEMEVARKHAHNHGGNVVEDYISPYDVRAAAIASLPGAVAQQRDLRRAEGIVTGREIASEKGRDTQRAEKSSTDARNRRQHGARCCGDGRGAAAINVERSEDRIEPFPIEIVWIGERASFDAARPVLVHSHQTRRTLVGKRLQQCGVNKGENSHAAAEASREHDYRCSRESGTLAQLAQRETRVLKKAFQHAKPPDGLRKLSPFLISHSTPLVKFIGQTVDNASR